jgi:hypothetical protein
MSSSLIEAIFLTRPLSPTVNQSVINSVQQVLLSTLTTWHHYPRLSLTFSAACPPRAIFAACISTQSSTKKGCFALALGLANPRSLYFRPQNHPALCPPSLQHGVRHKKASRLPFRPPHYHFHLPKSHESHLFFLVNNLLLFIHLFFLPVRL